MGLAMAVYDFPGAAPSFEEIFRAVARIEDGGVSMEVEVVEPPPHPPMPPITPAERARVQKVLEKVGRGRQQAKPQNRREAFYSHPNDWISQKAATAWEYTYRKTVERSSSLAIRSRVSSSQHARRWKCSGAPSRSTDRHR